MDQNNNMAFPLEERSRSSDNRDVFDFKNLRNCLPTTNHESGRCSVEAQSIRRSVWRLMKIKALMNMRKNISGLSQKLTWLDKNSIPKRSACLDEASTSQETEKNLERPNEETLERMTFKCDVPRKQENIISPVLISNRKIIKLQKYCEQTKEKCHRNILLVREKDRLKRTCFSRGLSLENMNEPEGDSSQQMKNRLCVALVNDILEEKRELQKEVEEAARLLHFRTLDEFLLEEMVCLRNSISVCICELDRYQNNDDNRRNTLPGQSLVSKLVEDGWEPVIQKECIQVWRKAFQNSYLYEYKVMGTFYDVPARTFFAVQTDIEYRKQWDKLVIKLDIIDKENAEDGCEVMHWVMHYPYPMYSRDYVYIRRAVISPETNTMVLVSRATDHPACPVNNKYVRVTEYSSRMVIRPHRTYDDNGFDYVLTYFDDPQAAFPTPAYNWMASSGVPDFVEKLHNAARELYMQEQRNKSSLTVTKSQNQKETCSSNNLECMYM